MKRGIGKEEKRMEEGEGRWWGGEEGNESVMCQLHV